MKINIIGDIAGRYDEFMLLLEKMPEADIIIAVGDLIDRGPKSKQVIEWFMTNQHRAIAIYGNHEAMMVSFCKDPDDWSNRSMWLHNGGKATLQSFKEPESKIADVPVEMVEWLEKCPLWWKNDQVLISHAPINHDFDELPDQYDKNNSHYFIWNRCVPYKRVSNDIFHIYGHNGEHRSHTDSQGEYAFCIDNSWHGELTGMHWPTKEIFRQEYIPEPERELTEEEKKKIEEHKKALELLSHFI